jgi:hypothetical protein
MRNANILVGTLEGKKRIWEDNIQMALGVIVSGCGLDRIGPG